jgi:hypothetical protein
MSFLARLKEKPPQVRAQYAFFAALLVTGVIGAVWVTTLPARFASFEGAVQTQNAPLTASAKEGLDRLMEGIGEVAPDRADEAAYLENEDSVPPPYTEESPGALAGLRDWDAATTTIPKEAEPARDPLPPTTPNPSPLPAPDTVQVPEATTSPTIILIGTTTKKAE